MQTAAPFDPLALIRSRRPGHQLPRDAYVHPSMYQADLEAIWYQEWLFVGHDFEIAEAGQFFTVQVGDYPLLVVRDDDGNVNAFVNMCRHRGSRLCKEESGDVGRIVCPYHGWTYALDGSLIHAGQMGDTFARDGHSLKRVHCRVVETYVFVCVAEQPHKSLDGFAAEMARFLAPYRLAEAKVAYETTVVEHGNWKLVWENNRECYHCEANHPELMNSFVETLAVAAVAGADDPAERAFIERCEAAGYPSRLSIANDGQYRLTRAPFAGRSVSQTMDGAAAVSGSAVFADTRGLNTGDLLYFHYPTTWNHVMPDHILSFRVLPLGPGLTQVKTKWLVHRDAVEGRDYDLQRLTEVWQATNAQDSRLVGESHAGISSPLFEPGSFSPLVENGPSQWVDWYCAAFADNWRARHGERRVIALQAAA